MTFFLRQMLRLNLAYTKIQQEIYLYEEKTDKDIVLYPRTRVNNRYIRNIFQTVFHKHEMRNKKVAINTKYLSEYGKKGDIILIILIKNVLLLLKSVS